MIINSSFNNDVFTHIKYNKRENTSDTNAHVKNETNKTTKDEVLEYKTDKDDCFTE